MHSLKLCFRFAWALCVLAFCLLHIASLFEFNARYVGGDKALDWLLGEEPSAELHECASKWCRACATEQRWNMFSTVGASSDIPCVVILHKNGTRTLLRSEQEPPLLNMPSGLNYITSTEYTEAQSEFGWNFNCGNGRLRKLESNVIDGPASYSSARLNYVRWRMRGYLEGRPELADDFLRVDLVSIRIDHPDPDGPPRLGGATWKMQYDERWDSNWPKQIKLTRIP